MSGYWDTEYEEMNSSEVKERLSKIGECTREVEEKSTPRQMKELLMKYETETTYDLGRQFHNEPWTHYVPCPVPVWSSLLHTQGIEGQRAWKCAIHHWETTSLYSDEINWAASICGHKTRMPWSPSPPCRNKQRGESTRCCVIFP